MADAPDLLSSLHLDPIEAVSADVIAHMNEDHSDANLDYARGLGGCPAATSATLLKINRSGILLQATTSDGVKIITIKFSFKFQHRCNMVLYQSLSRFRLFISYSELEVYYLWVWDFHFYLKLSHHCMYENMSQH